MVDEARQRVVRRSQPWATGLQWCEAALRPSSSPQLCPRCALGPSGVAGGDRESGYALALVLSFLIIVTILGGGVLAVASFEGQEYQVAYASRQAFYLAEAGAERTQARLAVTAGDWDATYAGGQVLFDREGFAGGTYSVTLDTVQATQATLISSGTRPYGDSGRTRTIELVVER